MKVTFAGGHVCVVVEKNAGTTHTVNTYIIPWELIIGAAGLICILVWAAVRKRTSQPK
jgi:hypothetical protein